MQANVLAFVRRTIGLLLSACSIGLRGETGLEDFAMQEYTFSITFLTETITVNTLPSYDVHLRFIANVNSYP